MIHWTNIMALIEATIDPAKFSIARRRYRPRKVRLLMIAESPPSSGGFFYFKTTIGKDHLFRETMKTLKLWPINVPLKHGVDKRPMLRTFQSMGAYLLDTCILPVDRLTPAARRQAVLAEIPRLLNDITKLRPAKIVVIKSSIFDPVRAALTKNGLDSRILNRRPIPFPSHGNQRIYRSELKQAFRKARMTQS